MSKMDTFFVILFIKCLNVFVLCNDDVHAFRQFLATKNFHNKKLSKPGPEYTYSLYSNDENKKYLRPNILNSGPASPLHRPPILPDVNQGNCEENQYFTNFRPACEEFCHERTLTGSFRSCISLDVFFKGTCFCKRGLIRISDPRINPRARCVKKQDCPPLSVIQPPSLQFLTPQPEYQVNTDNETINQINEAENAEGENENERGEGDNSVTKTEDPDPPEIVSETLNNVSLVSNLIKALKETGDESKYAIMVGPTAMLLPLTDVSSPFFNMPNLKNHTDEKNLNDAASSFFNILNFTNSTDDENKQKTTSPDTTAKTEPAIVIEQDATTEIDMITEQQDTTTEFKPLEEDDDDEAATIGITPKPITKKTTETSREPVTTTKTVTTTEITTMSEMVNLTTTHEIPTDLKTQQPNLTHLNTTSYEKIDSTTVKTNDTNNYESYYDDDGGGDNIVLHPLQENNNDKRESITKNNNITNPNQEVNKYTIDNNKNNKTQDTTVDSTKSENVNTKIIMSTILSQNQPTTQRTQYAKIGKRNHLLINKH